MNTSRPYISPRKKTFRLLQNRSFRIGLFGFVLFFLSSVLIARHAAAIGHKVWLVGWAYTDIFHPPKYDPEKVEHIARMKLYAQFRNPSEVRILGHRPFGEECVIYKIETFDSDSRKRQQERIVWVHWKPWTMNNGDTILRETDARQLVNASL